MKKILIAEDDADFALSLKLALESAGHVVQVASDGNQALACQRTFGADILITDLVMPDKDGFETLVAFRSEFPTTRIVVVSGAERLDPARYLRAASLLGADAAFRKPFDVEALLARLDSL